MDNLRSLVESFTSRLAVLIERQVADRARLSLQAAFSRDGARLAAASRPRRKLPRQLCPVPGCQNTAAPVFGMVCADHKGVPKRKIAKYRENRRAKKLRAAA
jgi:hypothetical protein